MNASNKLDFKITLFLIDVPNWSVHPWVFGLLVYVGSIMSVFCQLVREN